MAKQESLLPVKTRAASKKSQTRVLAKVATEVDAKARKKKKGKQDKLPPGLTRSVTFAIASVEGGTWQEFTALMYEMGRDATAAANWAIRQHAQHDNLGNCRGQLPAFSEPADIYDLAKRTFPLMPTGTLSQLLQDARNAYKRARTAIWHGNQSLPLFRFPAPFPVRAQEWTPVWVHDERPGFCFASGRLSDPDRPKYPKNHVCPHCGKKPLLKHWTVILAGGPPFKRQLGQFTQMMEGKAIKLSMAFLMKRCGGTHRNDTVLKAPGGGQSVRQRFMAKLVVHFPLPPVRPRVGCVTLRTDSQALWIADHEGNEVSPWVLNGDEMRERLQYIQCRVLDHAARRQRMAQDLKLERRTHVGKRQQSLDALQRICTKQQRFINTFIQQSAAGVVNWCDRQHIHTLLYDDSNRDWLNPFPWYALRQALRNKCAEAGIVAGGVLACEDDPLEVEAELASEEIG